MAPALLRFIDVFSDFDGEGHQDASLGWILGRASLVHQMANNRIREVFTQPPICLKIEMHDSMMSSGCFYAILSQKSFLFLLRCIEIVPLGPAIISTAAGNKPLIIPHFQYVQ